MPGMINLKTGDQSRDKTEFDQKNANIKQANHSYADQSNIDHRYDEVRGDDKLRHDQPVNSAITYMPISGFTTVDLDEKLGTERGINDIFKRAQAAFNQWAKLDIAQRTTEKLLGMLDFDFFELLDSLTIARSRKHIQKYYKAEEIGEFPKRLAPRSEYCNLTEREDVIGYDDIYTGLSRINLGIYAPFKYILPSRMSFYEQRYDTVLQGSSTFKQLDREGNLQTLMRINLLKRLESSVASFRITLEKILAKIEQTLERIAGYERSKQASDIGFTDIARVNLDDDDWLDDEFSIGDTIKINLSDMDVLSWESDLAYDRDILHGLLQEMEKVTPAHDKKLNTLARVIDDKIAKPLNPGNRKVVIFSASCPWPPTAHRQTE